jgi:hypothetical protein
MRLTTTTVDMDGMVVVGMVIAGMAMDGMVATVDGIMDGVVVVVATAVTVVMVGMVDITAKIKIAQGVGSLLVPCSDEKKISRQFLIFRAGCSINR